MKKQKLKTSKDNQDQDQDQVRTFYYTENLQSREFLLSFEGPWSPRLLKMVLNRATKGLREYKRKLIQEDRKNVGSENTRTDQ